MTFEQIEGTLPNGFHDAGLLELAVDYESRRAVLNLEVHVGTPDDADPERYRRATVTVTGLHLAAIDAPDAHYPFLPDGSPLWVQGASIRPGDNAAIDAALAALPADSVTYRFFVVDWNSFIYLAGANAEFRWEEDGQ